jgi:DNA-binding HxlR family transcriptional regulator
MPLPMRKSQVRPADARTDERCPIGTCMELLGGAWTPNVIWHLSGGARRFSELQADLKPISAKMLSARLKELEGQGVIIRTVLRTSPPSVEYKLTELGRELLPAIDSIARVGYKLKQAGARGADAKRRQAGSASRT